MNMDKINTAIKYIIVAIGAVFLLFIVLSFFKIGFIFWFFEKVFDWITMRLGFDYYLSLFIAVSATFAFAAALPYLAWTFLLGRKMYYTSAFVIGLTGIMCLLVYTLGNDIYFDRQTGQPLKWYADTPDGRFMSNSPGYDPKYGIPLHQYTKAIAFREVKERESKKEEQRKRIEQEALEKEHKVQEEKMRLEKEEQEQEQKRQEEQVRAEYEQEYRERIAREERLAVEKNIEATEQWRPSPYCAELLKECGGRPYGETCIYVRYVNNASRCQGYCAQRVNWNLKNLGFDVPIGRRMDMAPGPEACVGYRPNLGGTIEGAQCLARILGPQYRVGACHQDGFPYNVRLH